MRRIFCVAYLTGEMWLVFLSLTLGNAVGKTIGVSYWPENTVALIGKNLTIKCGVHAHNNHSIQLNWKFYPVGFKLENERFIYNNGEIRNPFQHFTINHTYAEFQYDLTTASAKITDAGSYRCTKYLPVPDQANAFRAVVYEAQVVILASDPVCTTNSTDDTIEEKNWLELSCQVNYSSNWPPALEWTQTGKRRGQSLVNEAISVQHFKKQSSRYTSIIPVDVSDHGSSFTATVYFSLQNLNHSSNNATNVPRYLFKWTSNTTNVLYGVRNVTVTPSRKVFQPGDSLACRADGNPKPTYQWTELSESTDNSMLLVHGSYLNVSRRMVREELYTFQCTASNDIDTKEFSDTVRIAFSVREMGFPSIYWVFIGFGAVFLFLLLALTSTCTYIVATRNHRKAEMLDLDKENPGRPTTTHFPVEDRVAQYEEIAETASSVPPISADNAYMYIREQRTIVPDASNNQELVYREVDVGNEQENESNNYELMVNIEGERPSAYTPVFLESHRPIENFNMDLHKQEARDYLELLE